MNDAKDEWMNKWMDELTDGWTFNALPHLIKNKKRPVTDFVVCCTS